MRVRVGPVKRIPYNQDGKITYVDSTTLLMVCDICFEEESEEDELITYTSSTAHTIQIHQSHISFDRPEYQEAFEKWRKLDVSDGD